MSDIEALPWGAAPGASEALRIPAYAGMTSPAAATLSFGKAFAKPALSKISLMCQQDMRDLPG